MSSYLSLGTPSGPNIYQTLCTRTKYQSKRWRRKPPPTLFNVFLMLRAPRYLYKLQIISYLWRVAHQRSNGSSSLLIYKLHGSEGQTLSWFLAPPGLAWPSLAKLGLSAKSWCTISSEYWLVLPCCKASPIAQTNFPCLELFQLCRYWRQIFIGPKLLFKPQTNF